MDQGVEIELGWGFYLIIVPLILTILVEWAVKPFIQWLNDEIFKLRLKAEKQDSKIEKIKKWIKF